MPRVDIIVRDATLADVERVAEIYCAREQANLKRITPLIRKEFEVHAPDWKERYVCVAIVDGQIQAYARAGYIKMNEKQGAEGMPDGWYLTGVNVDRAFRRRGIGRRLVKHRLDWLSARTNTIRYFVSRKNQPSIDLHTEFAFVLERRGISFPRTDFGPREGDLYVWNPTDSQLSKLSDGSSTTADAPDAVRSS